VGLVDGYRHTGSMRVNRNGVRPIGNREQYPAEMVSGKGRLAVPQMPQSIIDNSDLRFSDAYAILESQEPALPYDLDPRFSDPVICRRVGEVIARATILPSCPAWKSAG
jgi:hypothetical protein